MPIQAVLFDWDGVVVDSRSVGYACSVKIFEAYGLKSPPIETFLAEIGSDYVAYYQKYGMPKTVTEDQMNPIWDTHFPIFEERSGVPLRKGVPETFLELQTRGIKIGIVSGNTTSVIERTAARHGVLRFIDEVHADISGSKVAALRYAAQRFHISPPGALFVEDSPQVIAAGHSAGVIPVAITGGYGTEEALRASSPAYVIQEIPDLLAILEGEKTNKTGSR